MPERYRYAGFLQKPYGASAAANMLVQAMKGSCQANPAEFDDDLRGLLPKLRIAARILLQDANAADQLVTRTLERAILEATERPANVPRGSWLNGIMKSVLAKEGSNLLQ
jgi:DNA-directed RNA polymerase specialized sigma24 family protein